MYWTHLRHSDAIWRLNLVNNQPGNVLLSNVAKPLSDPVKTSYQNAPLGLISIQVMTYTDDENKFEWINLKMPPSLNEIRDLSGKPCMCKFYGHSQKAILLNL